MDSFAYLRPEAVPLSYKDLDVSQRRAFNRLVLMLEEATIGRRSNAALAQDELNEARVTTASAAHTTGRPRVETDRRSRVAFVSGARGTGKTTMLLSLLQAFSDPSQLKAPKDITTKIRDLSHKITWLEPLDMDPLPRGTNLFAAILARVDFAVQKLANRQSDTSSLFSERLLRTSDISGVSDFHAFMNDVALAWDSNLTSRAGEIDPDGYASEVMRVEHVRLALNERLNRVIELVARDVSPDNPDQLFVLPIDDFDLNVTRCLELIDLLRMISIPRLFFLVSGDVELARVVLNLKISGELSSLVGNAPRNGFQPIATIDVRNAVAHVAGNALRKFIPPGQRVLLEPMDFASAVGFRPKVTGKDIPTLRELANRFPVHHKDSRYPENFIEFLTYGDGNWRNRWSPATPLTGPIYEPRRFLELPPRVLADFWFALQDASSRLDHVSQHADQANPLIALLANHCRERLTEEPVIGGEQATWLLQERGSVFQRLTASEVALVARASSLVSELRHEEYPSYTITQCMSYGEWRVQRGQDRSDRGSKRGGTELSPSSGYALLLYTDLLALSMPINAPYRSGSGQRLNPFTQSLGRTAPLVMTIFHPFDVTKEWPLPTFPTFWDYSVFASRWELICTGGFKSAAAVAFAWIDLCIHTQIDTPMIFSGGEPSQEQWQSLTQRFHQVLYSIEHGFEWLGRAIVLLSPVIIGDRKDIFEVVKQSLTGESLAGYLKHSTTVAYDELSKRGVAHLVDWARRRGIFADTPDTLDTH
jgi:hypothetical protein